MKNYLKDIVAHTYDLGNINLIKVAGTNKETTIKSRAEDNSVIIEGKFITPANSFVGEFGMPNLGRLKTLLNLQEYQEGETLTLSRTPEGIPDGVNFENANGDFKNNYRFMSVTLVDQVMRDATFRGANWSVEFAPAVASIQRLKMQAQANSDQVNFQAKTDGSDLNFYFGDHSTLGGRFVFQPNVAGKVTKGWEYPTKVVISILDLAGDKFCRISDESGCIMITIDSGLAIYNYIIPASSK